MSKPHAVPAPWRWKPLGQVVNNIRETATIATDQAYELWSIPSFSGGTPEHVLGGEIGSGKLLVRPHDVLISKINPRINRVWIVSEPPDGLVQVASTEWIVARIKASTELLPDFLKWYARSPAFRHMIQDGVQGVTGSHTRAKTPEVLKLPVPVPPIEEQCAIVAAIEDAVMRIDSIERELDAVHRAREHFRMAVLRDAFSGTLVRLADVAASADQSRAGGGMSDAPHELPPGWEWQKLADFCTVTMGSSPKSANFTDSPEVGTPFLQGNAEFGERNPTPKKGTTDPLRLAPAGSALVSVRAPVGAVNVTEHEVCIGRGLAALTPERDEDLAFVYWVMQAARLRLQSRATGTTFPAVTGPALKSLPIPVPPPDDRDAIVAAVEDAFARIDALDALASETEKSLADLRASALHRAFSGEMLHTPASEKAHAAS